MPPKLRLPILDERSSPASDRLPQPSRLASVIERTLVQRPGVVSTTHWAMIIFYLALILLPPWLPAPPEHASPLSNFVSFSRFLIWCIWWPFVVLSMLGVGRAWCGLFCPEGALSAFASRHGTNRAIPDWMRWGGLPLVAFIGVTVLGQVFEVDERPIAQLAILGGSTVAAVLVGLVYSRRVWVWCRYLCPVSLLFGVFSRLGAMHFHVNHARLATWTAPSSGARATDPCPVQIHLPAMSTNRYCLMCFRCSGWRDAIHLDFRHPGKELLHINTAEPLFWEVIFLFGGAIGLPLGVFYGEILQWAGLRLVSLLLGGTLLTIAVLSLLTGISTYATRPHSLGRKDVRERFTCIGYLYTPLSLFSLFLGLSKPTVEYLESIGLPHVATDLIRLSVLTLGVAWSLYVGIRILRLQTGRHVWSAFVPHVVGLAGILVAWMPILSRR
jgi:polyferredoxin